MSPKTFIVPVKRGSNLESCLKVGNGLLCLTLRGMYVTKETMTFADLKLVTLVWKEANCFVCSFFCSIKLLVLIQQPSKLFPRVCLSQLITRLTGNFQCLFHLLYAFLMEAQKPVCISNFNISAT